jgi:5-methylthioribose kinase
LGQLHARSSAEPQLASEFDDTRPFIELRIRPFFERIAQRNASVQSAIAEIMEHILASRHTLVHGDYSPKNLLADGNKVIILDCEAAHWGDPRFDVAFCTAHLLLKSMRRGAPTSQLLAAARGLLSEYRRIGPAPFDHHFVGQLGCLLLARLDGDSPVDYLADLDVDAVKLHASELIRHPPAFSESNLGALIGVME